MIAVLAAAALCPAPARAQTVEALQRQIDELKAMVLKLTAEQQALRAAAASVPDGETTTTARRDVAARVASVPVVIVDRPAPAPVIAAATPPAPHRKAWYERLTLRGYTQMRWNEIVSGDRTAPAGVSRLRSVHDSGIGDGTNFTLRRVRLILQGDLTDHVSLYLQPDFASAVSNQTGGERREGFGQLRDAYVDWFVDDAKMFRVRFGQSKVPFGWENLQSSSNRLTLDRSDAINSAVPGERDLGINIYATPPSVQRIWDRLTKDGQKLFGNYGAFGLAVYNGQGINRTEANDGLMTVAMATWPFALDGLGDAFDGQVLEVGGAVLRNRFRPDLRAGGLGTGITERRVGLHAILYPNPLGIQAEWNRGRGPEYDPLTASVRSRPLEGGYVQGMWRVRRSVLGPFMPYARWQRYRGGWKALPNAPRLETDELELGIEFQPTPPLEFTIAWARMDRREADERRMGRAEGDVIRTQVQFNY